jgi:hypothetical protein
MKIAIILLSLSIATSTFANSVTDGVVLTSMAPTLSSFTTFGETEFNARKIMNDAQELIQSGEMSAFLGQKIKEVQEAKELSESEALDYLINESEVILGK